MNPKELTRQSYNLNAQSFATKFKKLMNNLSEEMNLFSSELKGKKILDLGSGGGAHAAHFTDKGFDVTCVDNSESMIALCKEKNLNALLMDIEALKFEDNAFDGIWAVTSLLHIPKTKLPRVIKKLHAILKDDGIFHVCVKEGDGETMTTDKKGTQRFFAYWQREELIKAFNDYFTCTYFKKVPRGNTVFLEFFFKKK